MLKSILIHGTMNQSDTKSISENHSYFMGEALLCAEQALNQGQVPIGALIVHKGKIIAQAYNKRDESQICWHHAEMIVLDEACQKLKNWRLSDCTLYSTLEPCFMCAGAIYQARIGCVVFGALDPKHGAMGSLYSLQHDYRLNYQPRVLSGVLKTECSEILKKFFQKLRRNKGSK